MIKQQVLNLVFNQTSKDDVVDLLMGMNDITGFTLSNISGFSQEHSQYDIEEQVAGYRQLCKAEIMHNIPQLPELLATLKELKTNNGIRYWVTPIFESGKL